MNFPKRRNAFSPQQAVSQALQMQQMKAQAMPQSQPAPVPTAPMSDPLAAYSLPQGLFATGSAPAPMPPMAPPPAAPMMQAPGTGLFAPELQVAKTPVAAPSPYTTGMGMDEVTGQPVAAKKASPFLTMPNYNPARQVPGGGMAY